MTSRRDDDGPPPPKAADAERHLHRPPPLPTTNTMKRIVVALCLLAGRLTRFSYALSLGKPQALRSTSSFAAGKPLVVAFRPTRKEPLLQRREATSSAFVDHGLRRRQGTMTMYFDDVSRHHTVEWDPASSSSCSAKPFFVAKHAPVLKEEAMTASSTGSATDNEAEEGTATDVQTTPQPPPSTTTATASVLNFPSYADQKKAAIQRMILGYDAQSASKLTDEEVREQTELWSKEAGVVRTAASSSASLGDELYGRLLGTSVCDARDVVTALAQLWNEIAALIKSNTDEFSPSRWTTAGTASSFASAAVGGPSSDDGARREADKVHFVVFPVCHELYDYKSMVTFVTAVEFAKEHCLHVGKKLTVGIFHPHYKHSPKLMSPERHSPFPTVALQLEDIPTAARLKSAIPKGHDARPKRQRGNHVVVRKSSSSSNDDDDDDDYDDEALAQLAYGKIHDLDGQRNVFEVLFNSAAVPGSDGTPVGRITKVDVVDESTLGQMMGDSALTGGGPDDDMEEGTDHALAQTFRIERQVRHRRLTDATVKDICRKWMSENRFVDRMRRKENRALRFMDTIDESRWTVSSEKIAEMEYAQIWTVISDLWKVGQNKDRENLHVLKSQHSTKTIVNATESAADTPASDNNRCSDSSSTQFPFMFLAFANPRPSAPPPPEKPQPSPIHRPVVVESSILVSTKFCAFNAPAFKRFAITVNAVLKRFTKGKMFLEVFHNEYVGQDGFDPSLRRSPFPMIQVSYVVNATSNNEVPTN